MKSYRSENTSSKTWNRKHQDHQKRPNITAKTTGKANRAEKKRAENHQRKRNWISIRTLTTTKQNKFEKTACVINMKKQCTNQKPKTIKRTIYLYEPKEINRRVKK
jgi:hypothetical protein